MGELQATVLGRKLPRVLDKEVQGNAKGKTQVWITPDKTNWTGNFVFDRITQLVSLDSFRLTPQSLTEPLIATHSKDSFYSSLRRKSLL